MTSESTTMTCQEFQALLPQLIEAGIDVQSHPHYRECELCRALLADLEAIAEAARQLLPIEDPPDQLWEQIEKAIEIEEKGEGQSQPPPDEPGSSTGPALIEPARKY